MGAWKRAGGVALGVAVQASFAVTALSLVVFLAGSPAASQPASLGLDALLALQFVVPHSILLLPQVRSRLERWIAPSFYGLFYCATTCLSLLVMFACWQRGSWALWELKGLAKLVMQVAFAATWLALLYSLHLTGLGYQTGFTPWWAWVRRWPAERRKFEPRGAYKFIRHPVYLSFLGLIWLTPYMTCDRAVLVAIWTSYIFVGSHLKDRRLAHYIGKPYRSYWARVPGFVVVSLAQLRVALGRPVIDPLPQAIAAGISWKNRKATTPTPSSNQGR